MLPTGWPLELEMRNSLRALAIAALVTGAAQPAAAAKYVTTWTGLVATGFDQSGVFGNDHTDLTGAKFTATFTFNDSLPGTIVFNNSFVTEIFGGRQNNDPNSQLQGVLTIKGKTHAFSDAQGSFFLLRDGYPTINNGNDEYRMDVASNFGDLGGQSHLNLDAFSNRSSFLSTHDYRTPFSFTNDGGADMTGDFAIYDPIKYGGLGSVANGTLRPTGITVGPQAAVPEPASWALMISGFGLAGGILRRRRGQALLAA
jgi:hypothetical protein